MRIDDGNDNDNDNYGSGGEEVNDGSNEGINDADEQTNFDGAENVGDMESDHSIASESESESFVETYRDFGTYMRKATRREAEKQFLLNKGKCDRDSFEVRSRSRCSKFPHCRTQLLLQTY